MQYHGKGCRSSLDGAAERVLLPCSEGLLQLSHLAVQSGGSPPFGRSYRRAANLLGRLLRNCLPGIGIALFAIDADVGFIPARQSIAQQSVENGRANRRSHDADVSRFVLFAQDQVSEPIYKSSNRRSVKRDAAFGEKVDHVLIRQRIAQIPTHRVKDDVTREAVVFERNLARLAPNLKTLNQTR